MDNTKYYSIPQSFSTRCVGFILLFFLLVVSVIISVYTDSSDGNFKKPFIFTYFNYSFMSILVVIYYIKEKIKACFFSKKKNRIREHETDIELIRNSTTDDNFSEAYQFIKKARKIEFREFSYHIVILLMFLCYFSKAFYYIGLNYLGRLNGTGVSYSMFFFILFEGILCFNKRCSILKLLASIIFAAGLILIILNQIKRTNHFSSDWIYGYLLIILSGLFYSLYAIFIAFFAKRYCEEFDIMLIIGLIGLYTLLLIPVFLLSLTIFGGETFEFPGFYKLWIMFIEYFLISIICEIISSYTFTIVSPKLVSVALTFSIPLTIAYRDIFFKDVEEYTTFDGYYISGTILIFISVLLIIYERSKKKKLNNGMLNTSIKMLNSNGLSLNRRSLFHNYI